MFDEDLCKQGSAFVNKIWNAYRLIDGWEVDLEKNNRKATSLPKVVPQQIPKTLAEIEDHYSKYRISDALMSTYKLVWDDFVHVLEMVNHLCRKDF